MNTTSTYGPYDFLDEIDSNPPPDYASRIRPFMLAICDRIVDSWPTVAADGLAIARRFPSDTCSVSHLQSARVACWNYLGSRSCDFEDTEVNAVRAAICTLYPDSAEPFDTIQNFLDFAIGAGLAELELLAVMRTHFDH